VAFSVNQVFTRFPRCFVAHLKDSIPRKLEWIANPNFQGYGFAECNWKFNPSGPLAGHSLDEMKRKYEAQRDKEFASHACVTGTNTTYLRTE
jgi:hypothetical protein